MPYKSSISIQDQDAIERRIPTDDIPVHPSAPDAEDIYARLGRYIQERAALIELIVGIEGAIESAFESGWATRVAWATSEGRARLRELRGRRMVAEATIDYLAARLLARQKEAA